MSSDKTEFWRDGSLVTIDTLELQKVSLRTVMDFYGYELVYTDSSVFFRLYDYECAFNELTKRPESQLIISFDRAVKMHNAFNDFGDRFKLVKRVKLQRRGYEIFCHTHKIRPT